MSQIIDGKAIAAQIKEELKIEVDQLKRKGKEVCLAVIQVGEDKASTIYVNNKAKACEFIGIKSLIYRLPEDTTQDTLERLIKKLSLDDSVHGILVQSPLPSHMNEEEALNFIDPTKDVDGLHPVNLGNLCSGRDGYLSCTPSGVIQLLKRYHFTIEGKECVVVGRSNMVGKPMGMLLMRENGTVTMAHSKTKNLAAVCSKADILVVAMGKPQFIKRQFVKDGAIVIDVGIHRNENNQLCGDVDYDDVIDKVSAITPVPGGVGPMTIAMLMYNCVEAVKCRR
ncbi:bifunctional methylenetetrahydrofolate dehydrogenase/methenyltetrahydrofolate cyclohydrolase FolD [Lachnospiraceae bacterium LCP25S3_G4]